MLKEQKSNKTLDELENQSWEPLTEYPTQLIKSIYQLRQKPLKDFKANDVRLMLDQNIGLKYLIPISIEILTNNPLEETIYFPGDLLLSLLNIDAKYWDRIPLEKKEVLKLISNYQLQISESQIINDEIRDDLFNAIINFRKRHS